jgi:hypothetical protein
MMTSVKLAVVGILVFAAIANAEDVKRAAPAPKEQRADSFTPDLGDIMALMQLRHIKLAFAGSLANWSLASYEVGEMRKSFETTAQMFPEFQSVPVAQLIERVSDPELKKIEEAVRNRDTAAFSASLRSLTAACNSCHESSNVGFIVIRIPTSSPFSNQLFAPLRTRN